MNEFSLAHYRMITDRKIKGHIECIEGEKRFRNIAEAENSTFCNLQRYILFILNIQIEDRIGNCRTVEFRPSQ